MKDIDIDNRDFRSLWAMKRRAQQQDWEELQRQEPKPFNNLFAAPDAKIEIIHDPKAPFSEDEEVLSPANMAAYSESDLLDIDRLLGGFF